MYTITQRGMIVQGECLVANDVYNRPFGSRRRFAEAARQVELPA
jgi:hypothetical protein